MNNININMNNQQLIARFKELSQQARQLSQKLGNLITKYNTGKELQ